MAGAVIHSRRGADGVVFVDVRGEVDVRSADRLRQVLVDAATQLRPTRIVVELVHVTFIDSTGIGALVAGRKVAASLGVGFALEQPSPFVATQLRQTGLYTALTGNP